MGHHSHKMIQTIGVCLYRSVRQFVLTVVVTVLALMFLPGLPPCEVEFGTVPLTPNKPFDGPLARNDLLNAAQALSEKVDGSSLGYFRVRQIKFFSLIFPQNIEGKGEGCQ